MFFASNSEKCPTRDPAQYHNTSATARLPAKWPAGSDRPGARWMQNHSAALVAVPEAGAQGLAGMQILGKHLYYICLMLLFIWANITPITQKYKSAGRIPQHLDGGCVKYFGKMPDAAWTPIRGYLESGAEPLTLARGSIPPPANRRAGNAKTYVIKCLRTTRFVAISPFSNRFFLHALFHHHVR